MTPFEFIDNPDCFPEQSCSLAAESFALTSNAHVLAGKPAADHIDRLQIRCADGSHIAIQSRLWKPSRKHGLCLSVLLCLPSNLKAVALEAKVESADASEQTAHGQHITSLSNLQSPALPSPRRFR